MEVYLLSVPLTRHRAIVPRRRAAIQIGNELDERLPRHHARDLADQVTDRDAPTVSLQRPDHS